MKRSYEKPAVMKREQLANVTAKGNISPFFKSYPN